MDLRRHGVPGSKASVRASIRKHRKRQADDRSKTPLFKPDWQSLLGYAGALIGLLFVLLNAGYLHFYEKLGVRPEEVGLDRVGVLARTAGIAIAAFLLVFGVVVIMYAIPLVRRHRAASIYVFYAAYTAIFIYSITSGNMWIQGVVVPLFLLLIACVFVMSHKAFGKMIVVAAALAGMGGLLLALAAELSAVEYRLVRVAAGHPVKPVTLFKFHILDVSAERAQVTLLDKMEKPPIELNDPHLLFLGKGPSGVAFVGCGNTIVMPADKLLIRMGGGLEFGNSRIVDKSASSRWEFCQCVHAGRDHCRVST